MKKIISLVLSISLIFSVIVLPTAVSVSAAEPYVYSEGFEGNFVDGGGQPLSSNVFLNNIQDFTSAEGTAYGGISTKYARTGSKSYEFRSYKAKYKSAYFPVGSVVKDKTYLVDLYFYVDQKNTIYNGAEGHAGKIGITANTASDTNFWVSQVEEATILPSSTQSWQIVHEQFIKDGWHHFSAQFKASDSKPLYIAVGAKDGTATVDLFVDDVTVREITSDTVVVTAKNEYNLMKSQPADLLIAGVKGTTIDYIPTRPGYNFGGWFTDTTLKTPVTTFSDTITQIYPKWSMVETFDNGLSSYAHKHYSINKNPENARTGNNSLKISGDDLAWTLQGFPLTQVTAGATYVMDFWYKAKSGTSYGLIDFVPIVSSASSIWSGNKSPVGYAQFKDVDANPRAGFLFHPWDCVDEWQHAAIYFTVDNTIGGNNYLWFNYIADQTMSLEMYIDDITLTQLSGTDTVFKFCNTYETDSNLPICLAGTPGGLITYVPTRENCIFDGWYTSNDYTTKVTAFSTGTTTLYAKWKSAIDKKSVVSFDGNGGIIQSDKNVIFDEGAAISVPNPKRVDYDFLGWYDLSGNKVTVATGAMSLKAEWTKNIGFESLYRTNANNIGYMLKVTDKESAVGDKSVVYNYSSDNWDAPKLTPVFTKPADWNSAYKDYFTYENDKIVSLSAKDSAPNFVKGEFYSAKALTQKPIDFDTNYSHYSYLSNGNIVRLTSKEFFENGKYFANGYGRNNETDAFVQVGKVLNGRQYTVNFKYKLGENNENTIKIGAINYPIIDKDYPNSHRYTLSEFTVPDSSNDGNWHDGQIVFIAGSEMYNGIVPETLGLYVVSKEAGVTSEIYIDDVSVIEKEIEKTAYKGDVNNDRIINAKDLARLQKYLAKISVEIFDGADANGDTLIDAKDLTRLKKILCGLTEKSTASNGIVNLEGIKWAVVGDSLTDRTNGTANVRYYDIIADKYGMTTTMLGVGGSGYVNDAGKNDTFYSRVNKIPTDSNLVTIFGSCNDFWKPLGNLTDTTTATVCGSMRSTILAVKKRCPDAHIIVISPLTVRGTLPPWEESGDNGHNYVEAQKKICEEFGIMYLDQYNSSELESWDQPTVNTYYWHHDGCHPNDLGNEIYYHQIEQAVLTEYGY